MKRIFWRLLNNFHKYQEKYSSEYLYNKIMASVQPERLNLLHPPPQVNGMKTLDKTAFKMNVLIPYFLLQDEEIKSSLKILKRYLLKLKHINAVQSVDGGKQILLNPASVKSFKDFTEDEQNKLSIMGLEEKDLNWKEIELTYDNWSTDDILKAILPTNEIGGSGYSVIGHIIHLNLKEHLHDYGPIIGRVLLDKTPYIRSVVNKINTIESTFRNFKMEVLAGENDTHVKVKENGAQYEFDFAEVYWNPRLCTEHARIVSKLRPADILYDIFAGVGPFSIPAGKKKCAVLANDLNPHSYKWLASNCKLNKVDLFVKTFNMDGREFIYKVLKPDLINQWEKEDSINRSVHIVMNLPSLAPDFLDAFKGLFADNSDIVQDKEVMPLIHCYCFVKEENTIQAAKNLVENRLGCSISENKEEIICVRSVAPNKVMMRVSFHIPKRILITVNDICEPLTKKAKTEERFSEENINT